MGTGHPDAQIPSPLSPAHPDVQTPSTSSTGFTGTQVPGGARTSEQVHTQKPGTSSTGNMSAEMEMSQPGMNTHSEPRPSGSGDAGFLKGSPPGGSGHDSDASESRCIKACGDKASASWQPHPVRKLSEHKVSADSTTFEDNVPNDIAGSQREGIAEIAAKEENVSAKIASTENEVFVSDGGMVTTDGEVC